MDLIPVTILTGFLGSGKTTLLKRVLTEAHGHRIAVIENEFGEENIDNDILVADGAEQIIQMNNGCVCCSIREDLKTTLSELADRRLSSELNFERVVIETTGLADPGPVVQTFFFDEAISRFYQPDAILTLVDAAHGMKQLDERQEVRRQVGFADHIFISKADLVSDDALHSLLQRLRCMNSRAPIKAAYFGNVALADVFDLRGFYLNADQDLESPDAHAYHDEECAPGHHHHAHRHDDVRSFVFRSAMPLHPDRFEQFINAAVRSYGARMLRYKGILHLAGADRKVIFQGVHQLVSSSFGSLWANDERLSRIVFIGIDLPDKLFLQSLDHCLIRPSL